jgi:hypothetical protein
VARITHLIATKPRKGGPPGYRYVEFVLRTLRDETAMDDGHLKLMCLDRENEHAAGWIAKTRRVELFSTGRSGL